MKITIPTAGVSTNPESTRHVTNAAEVQQAFQKFVAGTFYGQMLKSLRKMHNKAAYFDGGQAEEIFRGQMDQQVAEDLPATKGSAMSASLYNAFAQRLRLATNSNSNGKQ